MRHFPGLVFLGAGEHAVRLVQLLQARLNEAVELSCALQQSSQGMPESEHEDEDAKLALNDAVRDLAAALLGRQMTIGDKLPYPYNDEPLRLYTEQVLANKLYSVQCTKCGKKSASSSPRRVGDRCLADRKQVQRGSSHGLHEWVLAEDSSGGGDEGMAAITSATLTATYNPGKLTVKVDASGENSHDRIVLDQIEPSPSLYLDGNVLCIDLQFKERHGAVDHHWTAERSFDRSADYVVLLHDGRVLTARSVDRVRSR
jgi:hypothetical protein